LGYLLPTGMMEAEMSKARSPQYPAIGLKEAVEKVTAVYTHDYQNPIPRAVAAGHMGYQSLNGKSLGVLSAVLKYGLLEGRGDETRVSDLAVSIIAHPPGTPERAEGLREAASKPELFGELDARFQGGKASDQALRSYLLTQKFIPSAADAVIRSYRETKQLVEGESSSYDAGQPQEARPMPQSTALESMSRVAGVLAPPQPGEGRQVDSFQTKMAVSMQDDRVEIVAVLYDQQNIQKLIDRLTGIKPFYPEVNVFD
jgi:hypothetical protein